jgi:hypothetical protein
MTVSWLMVLISSESIIHKTNQDPFLSIASAFAARRGIMNAHQSLASLLEVAVVGPGLLELVDLVQDLVRRLDVSDFG